MGLSKWVDCPYCRRKIDLAECPVVATNYDGGFGQGGRPDRDTMTGAKPVSGARSYKEHFGQPILRPAPDKTKKGSGIQRLISMFDVSDLAPVSSYGLHSQDLPARACWECGTPLPDYIGNWPILTIGIVGSKNSGKSHFLAALIREGDYRRELRSWGIEDFSLESSSSEVFQQTYQHIFYDHSVLRGTTHADSQEAWHRPLAVQARFFNGQKVTLLFHDIAGETLETEKTRARDAYFLRNAAGIIFLIDPLMIEKIARRLPAGYGVGGFVNQGHLINACVSELGARASRTPMAIALSKSDLIEEAARNSATRRDRNYEARFLFRQMASFDRGKAIEQMLWIDKEVRYVLHEAEAFNVLAIADKLGRYAPVTFHAVAPIGFQPTGSAAEQNRPFEPLRCLDPLIAILSSRFPGMMQV